MFPERSVPAQAYQPLSYIIFIQYIAIPFATHHLIAQDLGTTLEAALVVMNESREAGDVLHDDDASVEEDEPVDLSE
jgi:hypothetical protein